MESHKKRVLDIFQEHIAFCHDVVLLSKSRQGVSFRQGSGAVQSAIGAPCRFQESWKMGAQEGHLQPQEGNQSAI